MRRGEQVMYRVLVLYSFVPTMHPSSVTFWGTRKGKRIGVAREARAGAPLLQIGFFSCGWCGAAGGRAGPGRRPREGPNFEICLRVRFRATVL